MGDEPHTGSRGSGAESVQCLLEEGGLNPVVTETTNKEGLDAVTLPCF